MQKLWSIKLNWDESFPTSIYTLWTTFGNQLPLLNNISFKRGVLRPNANYIELHGFCDACEMGYGVRSIDQNNTTHCQLLCAKSRVAPLKTVSIPRLELCGAHLLAKFYKQVIDSIDISVNRVIFWTDSTIALQWIHTSPHILKTLPTCPISSDPHDLVLTPGHFLIGDAARACQMKITPTFQ